MRTILVMFDSLNREALGAYGGTAVATPNFDRFAAASMVFDRHYVGSLPCMPARRDMHTGRLNFMHRPWGPLEPFDHSYARLLSGHGVYTHIVSDHLHYFEDGGGGYVTAFDSWEFVRGQEYDPVKVMVQPPVERLRERFDERHYPFATLPTDRPVTRGTTEEGAWRRSRHAVNTLFTTEEADWPTTRCFAAALDFLDTNVAADDWFLQLECFDPHEPFTAPERFRKAYVESGGERILDWPVYEEVTDSADEIREIRGNYAALVAMCDERFGELLDRLDAMDAWKDTCVILTTDHGFLLGEHGWWGKNRMPYYEEIAHVPLMIRHPDGRPGRHDGLTQTTDLMPTLLELWSVDVPAEVTAHSLLPALEGRDTGRESAILGMFGGPVCVTDGRWTYYRYPESESGEALAFYTLAPNHIDRPFTIEELRAATLAAPFDFTDGVPLLRVPHVNDIGEAGFAAAARRPASSPLYDLLEDPRQEHAVENAAVEARLVATLHAHFARHDAPAEMFRHYGLTPPGVGHQPHKRQEETVR